MCGGKNTEKNSEFQMGHDLPYTSRMQKKFSFPRQMTAEKPAQKFHTDDASLPRSG